MITATKAALDKIASLRVELKMPESFLKIGIQEGGCSGFSYIIDMTTEIEDDDLMIIIDSKSDETILIERKSYLMLNDMKIDYVNDDRPSFRFKVPDTSECECGMSFNPGA